MTTNSPQTRGAYDRVAEWVETYERCHGNERLACGYREVPLLLTDIKALLTEAASTPERSPS